MAKTKNTSAPPNSIVMNNKPLAAHLPARILVFDSGVGGLTIVAEIQRQLPACRISYCSDNAAFPYGTKSEKELIGRVDKVLRAACNLEAIDIIVIACNSASTLALPYIRNHFEQPVVGVVPAIKPAAQLSQNKRIGLLATPGTVSRSYTKQLINDFASDCQVTSVGSSQLVNLAERKLRGETIEQAQLQSILKPFKHTGIDTLILACTHFPLLKEEIQNYLGSKVSLVDSADAIARRIAYLLKSTEIKVDSKEANSSLFTAKNGDVDKLFDVLKKYHLQHSRYLQV